MPFYGTVLGKQKITLCFASYPSRVGNWGVPQFALPIARRSWQTVCQNIPWPWLDRRRDLDYKFPGIPLEGALCLFDRLLICLLWYCACWWICGVTECVSVPIVLFAIVDTVWALLLVHWCLVDHVYHFLTVLGSSRGWVPCFFCRPLGRDFFSCLLGR